MALRATATEAMATAISRGSADMAIKVCCVCNKELNQMLKNESYFMQ